MEELLLL